MEILEIEIQMTVEKPDRIVRLSNGDTCYLRKITGKRELLVFAEQTDETTLEIKSWGWVELMFHLS